MSNTESLSTLNRFRNSNYPFLYDVGNNFSATDISKLFPKGFGLETGFGIEPTRLFHIANNTPWIVTEKDGKQYAGFKDYVNKMYSDVDPQVLLSSGPIITVCDSSTAEIQKRAKIVVYRNLRPYKDMKVIPFKELRPGQRVVFIVNDAHSSEVEDYRRYLDEYGYNPEDLKLRIQTEPRLSRELPPYKNAFVLDIQK